MIKTKPSYLENSRNNGNCQQHRPLVCSPQNRPESQNLRDQNRYGDDKLVNRAHSAPQINGRNLRKIHRSEARVQSGVDADEEPAEDDHFEGAGRL